MIKEIRQEIFRLAKEAKDLDVMRWYVSLDECFENNELQKDMLGTLKWRCNILAIKKEPVNDLLWSIEDLLKLEPDIWEEFAVIDVWKLD